MSKLTEPPPTPNPAVHHGALPDPGETFDFAKLAASLRCKREAGGNYVCRSRAAADALARTQNTPDSQRGGA